MIGFFKDCIGICLFLALTVMAFFFRWQSNQVNSQRCQNDEKIGTYIVFSEENVRSAIGNTLGADFNTVYGYKKQSCEHVTYTAFTSENKLTEGSQDDFKELLSHSSPDCTSCVVEQRKGGTDKGEIYISSNRLICESIRVESTEIEKKMADCIPLKELVRQHAIDRPDYVITARDSSFVVRKNGAVIAKINYRTKIKELTVSQTKDQTGNLIAKDYFFDGDKTLVFFANLVPWGCAPQSEKEEIACAKTMIELFDEFRLYGGVWTVDISNFTLKHIWKIPAPVRYDKYAEIDDFDSNSNTIRLIYDDRKSDQVESGDSVLKKPRAMRAYVINYLTGSTKAEQTQ